MIEETAIVVPDLADIIPLASKLSGRLEYLESSVTALLNLLDLESRYTKIEAKLKACAKTTSMLAKTPEPLVLFLSFGESSLDFELRVWALDVGERLKIKSELHQEIDRRFREAKIEIAFPQRDLHLRSVGESVHIPPPKTSE